MSNGYRYWLRLQHRDLKITKHPEPNRSAFFFRLRRNCLLPTILITITADVAGLVADIACLSVLRTVPRYVPHLVAVVARLRETPVIRIVGSLRTRAGDVAGLVAVVARRRVGALITVFGDVALPVAPVATVSTVFTVTRKMTKSVTFVTFLAAAAEASFTPAATVSAAAASLRALAGEMTRTVAFVAHT